MNQFFRNICILSLLMAEFVVPGSVMAEGEAGQVVRLTPQPVFAHKKFNQPVAMVQQPDSPYHWYVVERGGKVYQANDINSSSINEFADLSDRVDASYPESGLMSMAIHPDFAHNHSVFFTYTTTGKPLVSRLSRFTVSSDGSKLIKDSEQILLSVANQSDKHNITHVAFGPDGYLYVGFGDGHEGGGDPFKNGQNTQNLMASIIRIDIDKDQPYSIPSDNPFADGKGGSPELFAWGFRNPWRWSFDSRNGDLWVADVGEFHWEEIDRVMKGGNYGWPIREGGHCYGSRLHCALQALCLWNCADSGLVNPIIDYSHDDGCAVIGGYVYRGLAIPALQGVYLFSDACNGTIWGLFPASNNSYMRKILYTVDAEDRAGGYLTVSFSQDYAGNIYSIYYNGMVYKIEQSPATSGK